LPREAVTKFLSHCNECRRTTKTTIVAEIKQPSTHKSENDNDNESKKNSTGDECDNNNVTMTSNEDYPKSIENYYLLLRALYENSSILSRIKHVDGSIIRGQSCESLNENVKVEMSNQVAKKKNINININNNNNNNDDNDDDGEKSRSNIFINSLDVSINVASKARCDGSYSNINKVRISCTTTPTKRITQANQQLVTSSSSSSSSVNDNNFLPYLEDTKAVTVARAARMHGVRKFETPETIPSDDASLDNHNKTYNMTTNISSSSSTTGNNHFTKYSNGENDVDDYHTKSGITSIDAAQCNKRNSTGDIKPITSTYLLMTRSMGLTDEDALNLVSFFLHILRNFVFFSFCCSFEGKCETIS
jgi:hypothetical protein